jgi:hypothetical protein
MDARKPLDINIISHHLSGEVLTWIRMAMKKNQSDELEFHRYRMVILSSDADTPAERLIELCNKVSSKMKFDIIENVSDKILGEAVARYIFSRIMLSLNDEYRKIVDHELDRVTAESKILLERSESYKKRISHH